MTAQQFIAPQPLRFQGAAPLTALDKVLQKSTGGQKLLGKALQLKEGDNGLSYITFLQDTLVALIPRALVSRSTAELTESTFLELMESAVLYYGLPIIGSRVFKPFFNRVAGVHQLNDGKPITREFKATLSKVMQRKVTGAKAATILSTFGVTLIGGEYVIHYLKNLITAKMFNKDSFSDVVNLSQGQISCSHGSPVVHKAQNRIMQCLLACGGILGGSFLLARGPEKVKSLEYVANKVVQHLNFAETKNGGLSLSRKQMELYMGLSVLAYLDSARDNLERVETASRLLIVLPYLARGQGWLQKGLLKVFSEHFTPILKDGVFQKNEQAKSLEALAQEALDKHPKDLHAAAKALAQPLRQKGILTGAPLAFGVLGTGVGVGLLNRFWTQYRYQQQQQEKQGLATPAATPNRNGSPPLPTYNPRSPGTSFSNGEITSFSPLNGAMMAANPNASGLGSPFPGASGAAHGAQPQMSPYNTQIPIANSAFSPPGPSVARLSTQGRPTPWTPALAGPKGL